MVMVAAANRAGYVVDHYQQAPQVVEALSIMVQAYRHLGLATKADETYAILKHNFPDAEQTIALAT